MTAVHRAHDLAVTADEDAHADRLHEACQLEAGPPKPEQPCTCPHDVEDHWPREGCVRRDCLCWWSA